MRETHPLPRRAALPVVVASCLRDRLARGDWLHLLPGELELAMELQVGRNTVRSALAVLEMEGLIRTANGRRREVLARAGTPRPLLVNTAVLLLPAPLHTLPPSALLWMDHLRSRLQAADWQSLTVVDPTAFRRAPAPALDALAARHPGAVWVLFRSTAAIQRWFEKSGTPAVIAGSCHSGVNLPQVDTDFRAASRHAATRFLGLGHRRLAVLAPMVPFPGDEESLQGFQEGVAAVDGASLRRFPIRDSKASVIQALHALLAAREPPTAIFTLEARHTATATTFLTQQRVQVPGDISLLSRDHDGFLNLLVPEPARYERQPEAFAKKLGHLVIVLGSSVPLKQQRHLIMPTFVRGETLARPPVPR